MVPFGKFDPLVRHNHLLTCTIVVTPSRSCKVCAALPRNIGDFTGNLPEFANTRTPSPPWVHVVRTMVPLSSCDEAATYLIKALGGEDVARQVVGGVKWWQVRGVNGLVFLQNLFFPCHQIYLL